VYEAYTFRSFIYYLILSCDDELPCVGPTVRAVVYMLLARTQDQGLEPSGVRGMTYAVGATSGSK